MVFVLNAFIPSEFKEAMSVETAGKVVLYACAALELLTEVIRFCIWDNLKIFLIPSKQ